MKLFLMSYFLSFGFCLFSNSQILSVYFLKDTVVIVEGEAGEERESSQVQVTCKAGLCVGRPFHSCGAGRGGEPENGRLLFSFP